jgi:hypothetical protein
VNPPKEARPDSSGKYRAPPAAAEQVDFKVLLGVWPPLSLRCIMEKVARVFATFAEAEVAEAAYYRSLTPQNRLAILLELTDQGRSDHEPQQGLERVYRIVELAQS